MPTDEQALLSAIWADPHDDLPRLVYADWLEETGVRLNQARAELIRVQCALERVDEAAERRALRERESRVLRSYRQRITAGAAGAVRRANFSRGFPYPTAGWSSYWKPVDTVRLSAAPLWQLECWPPRKEFNALFQSVESQRLGRLAIRSDAHEWLESIVLCHQLRNVSRLEIEDQLPVFGDRLMASVAESTCLVSLRDLHWSGMALTETGIRRLAHGPLAGRLRGLGLNAVGLTDRMMGVMSESPLREGVRELSVCDRAMGDSVVQYLACKKWKLHRLELVQSNLTDAGLERLAAWPGLADLEHLNLLGNSFGPAGATALAASPYLMCSPHCSVRVSPDATDHEWTNLLGRLGENVTLVALGTG